MTEELGKIEKPESDVMELKVVTSNDGKIREFRQAFDKTPIYPVKVPVGYPEVQASSLEEVVDFGLSWLKEKIRPPFVIDDAGVFVDGLNGFPGAYSRYVYDTIGPLGLLKQMEGLDNRTAFRWLMKDTVEARGNFDDVVIQKQLPLLSKCQRFHNLSVFVVGFVEYGKGR